ncbi:MAG: TolC family protein [Bacteroidota bacterium]|nr:TolC family protein [Bacteroidota bacterium]
MIRRNSLFAASATILIAGMLAGCGASKPVALPPVTPLPLNFTGTADSSGIGQLNWRQVFADKHLTNLIDSALANNTDLLAASQRIEMSKAQYLLSRGNLLPSLNASITAGGDKYGDYTMNGVGNFDTNLSGNINEKQKIPAPVTPDFFLGLRSSWEIDIWGKLKQQRRAAAARFAASNAGRQLIVTMLVAEVANLYYELLTLDTELKILQKNILLQESALDIVRIQKEGGRATELAIQQFRAQLLNTQEQQYTVSQRIVATENQLNAIIGRYPAPILRDTSLMQQRIPQSIRVGLPSQLLQQRPDIRRAEFELEAAKADVAAVRKAFYPSLTLTPYAGFNAFKAGLLLNGGSVAYGALGGLTAPLFNQNKLRAGLNIANAQHKEAIYQYQKVLLNSYGEVVTQLNSLENNRRAFQLKQQEVNELSNAVNTAKELYLTGYASYLEVITAQKGVLDAELQLATNKKESFQSLVGLYRALGGGWN